MDALITQYSEEQRDSFGQYSIGPGATHIFEFKVPFLSGLVVTSAHILPNSQDFSLDMWISQQPLDGLLLREGFGHFKLIRRSVQHTIYDELLKSGDTDVREFLASNTSCYLNVKNLQNRQNAYQLTFDPLPLP